jgi:hypothetical protein
MRSWSMRQSGLLARVRIPGYNRPRTNVFDFESPIVHLILLFVMYTSTTTSVPSTVCVYVINRISLVKTRSHGYRG